MGYVTASAATSDAPIYADGYVGMQIIPRRDGYVGGIDHFGMVVDDVETVLERMQKQNVRRKGRRHSRPTQLKHRNASPHWRKRPPPPRR